MSYESASDKVACWSMCASTKNCNWFSYEKTGIHQCILFENCPEIEEEQYPQFISGNKDCQYIYCVFNIFHFQMFFYHSFYYSITPFSWLPSCSSRKMYIIYVKCKSQVASCMTNNLTSKLKCLCSMLTYELL